MKKPIVESRESKVDSRWVFSTFGSRLSTIDYRVVAKIFGMIAKLLTLLLILHSTPVSAQETPPVGPAGPSTAPVPPPAEEPSEKPPVDLPYKPSVDEEKKPSSSESSSPPVVEAPPEPPKEIPYIQSKSPETVGAVDPEF